MLRLTRSFRLLRFFKLARLLKLSSRLKNVFGSISGGFRRLLFLMISLVVLIHIATCLFYFIAANPIFGENGDQEGGETWLATVKDWPLFVSFNGKFHNPPFSHSTTPPPQNSTVPYEDIVAPSTRYIASAYFITFSLLSVGFGDVHAVTTSERFFCILLCLLGSGFLAFLITSTTDISNQLQQQTIARRTRMAEVQEWVTDRVFPSALRSRLYSFFDNLSKNVAAEEGAFFFLLICAAFFFCARIFLILSKTLTSLTQKY